MIQESEIKKIEQKSYLLAWAAIYFIYIPPYL